MLLNCILLSVAVQGAVVRQAAREVLQTVEIRFAREVAEEGAELLEKRLATCLERYGDDVAVAVRRVGPKIGIESVEKYGAGAARLLADHGDEGARLLAIEGESAVRISGKYGSEGVAQLSRHRGVAAPLIEEFGTDGLRALGRVSTEGASAMSRVSGEVRASGRAKEILAVVEKFGDRACQFIWRNKGVIFGSALLAAFLRDPEPYLNGAKLLIVDPAAAVAKEAASRTNWTLVVLAVMAGAAGWIWVRRRRKVACQA